MSLLLTADNKVAGAAANTAATRSNAVGLVTSVSGTTATVQLLWGLELSGDTNSSEAYTAKLQGQMVRVSSERRGVVTMSKLTSAQSYGALDMEKRTLGSKAIADNAVVYEKAHTNAAVAPVALSAIAPIRYDSSCVEYAEYDWAGRVSLLVLKNVTGDALTYGRVTMEEGSITVTYGNGQALGPVASPYQFADGSYAGVALSSDGSQVCAAVGLKKLENVPNSAWKSADYVTVGGVTYPVSEDVVCYNRTTGKYVTLSAARAFASQGQARSAALSLKFGERELFFRDSGEYPVLLLDDVLSELDGSRQRFVATHAMGGQSIITCCENERQFEGASLIELG